MKHYASTEDQAFLRAFESLAVAPEEFDHSAHVRLAYVYLCEHSIDAAADKMKQPLLAFLSHLDVDESKYHETVTRAWTMAASYFMNQSKDCNSAAVLISGNPQLLDTKIMLTHYSAQILFSSEARQSFVAPDIPSIPPSNGRPTNRSMHVAIATRH
jgi:hypothetical protein